MKQDPSQQQAPKSDKAKNPAGKPAPEAKAEPPPETAKRTSAVPKSSKNPATGKFEPAAPAGGGGLIRARRRRMLLYTVGAALAGLLAAWCFASLFPNYLLYATPAMEADAVVVFAGNDFEARQKMADELVAKGWAKFVILPAKGEILETRVSKGPVTPEKTRRMAEAVRRDVGKYYVEQTHVEVIQALELMEHIAARRAIFVSSPYHMRRIRIMAGRVFPPDRYEIAYLPAADDPPHQPWFASWRDVKWVFSEWVKIVWFFLYSPFV